MKADIKKLWLEALRSGEYEQGTGQLRRGDRYCCLGVLTDIYLKKHGYKWGRGCNKSDIGLHNSVVWWAGFDDSSPKVDGEHLTNFNDGGFQIHRHTFLEIADLIEETL